MLPYRLLRIMRPGIDESREILNLLDGIVWKHLTAEPQIKPSIRRILCGAVIKIETVYVNVDSSHLFSVIYIASLFTTSQT